LSETDPFSDAAFVGRLQKLLPMLGSQQPGEADAARRKLIDHLGQHRLTLLDVAGRLRDNTARPAMPQASFSQGAREMSLERQLAIARQAKEEASQEALIAGMRIRALESELQQTTFALAGALQSQVRARVAALAGWGVAGVILLLLLAPRLLHLDATGRAGQVAAGGGPPREVDESGALMRMLPGQERGTAAVQDLAIRLAPNDQATIRAFLNRGELMAIDQRIHVGAQTWLLVHTATVKGWTRSGDVLQP
jgi:hypothetical protein